MRQVLLRSILESPSVSTKAKFPLAIRYNDETSCTKLLRAQELNVHGSPEQELTSDGRCAAAQPKRWHAGRLDGLFISLVGRCCTVPRPTASL